MKIARILIAVLVGSSALFAQKDTWKYVGRAETMKSYYETESAKKIGEYVVQAWVKLVPVSDADRQTEATHRQKLNPSGDYTNYAYTMILAENDCVKTRTRPLSTIDYDSKGVAIQTHEFKQPADWYYPPPESIGLSLLQAICVDAYPPSRDDIDRLLGIKPKRKP